MAERTLLRTKRVESLRDKYELMVISTKSHQPSRLILLPREIHLEILKHLTPAGRLSLAVTCKGLWEAVHMEYPHAFKVTMNEKDKVEFLGLMTDRYPRFLFCYCGCTTLHERLVDEFSIINNGGPYKLCATGTRAAFPAPCLHYALSYEMLDLVLRFEELTSDYGVPASLLSHKCDLDDRATKPAQLPCRVEVLPRICDGRLLLRIDSFIKIDRCSELRKQAERIPCKPCLHMLDKAFMAHCFLTLRYGKQCTKRLGQEWSAMDRCPHCATDASSKMISGEDETLLVRVWKDFGRRRGHSKQPWTGHVATAPKGQAAYASGSKHLGHVFDGNDSRAEKYARKIAVNVLDWDDSHIDMWTICNRHWLSIDATFV